MVALARAVVIVFKLLKSTANGLILPKFFNVINLSFV